ncbi:rifampicin phosphotransferase-like isoform X2 [Tachypleus tridentatus]|uniref:rifampicin phosphotransferase-like isoform X2 n=1 Tax=Tachypleus tridentatus TaxID=6853 RepID=UPI003FD1C54B
MGAILAVPVGFLIYHFLMTEDLQPLHGIYNLPNRYFQLKRIITLLYLKIRRWGYRRRFDLYDMNDLQDLVKTGCLPPVEEIILEEPQPPTHVVKNLDEIFFYGVKSTGECLLIKMSRLKNKMSEVMLFLRTAAGKQYCYPDGPMRYVSTGNSSAFRGGGITITCISAMRKWRISFNGILREKSAISENTRIVHVKFNFIWNAMSDVQDMTSDIDPGLVADALAKEPWAGYFPNISKLENALNIYEQAGQFLGTVIIDELEDELTLWGIRKRSLGQAVRLHRSVDFYGFTTDGNLFHVGATSLPRIVSNLVYGHYIHSNGMMFPLTSCDFQLPLLAENKLIPSSEKFTFVAAKKMFECTVDFGDHLCDFIGENNEQHFKHSSISLNGIKGSGISVFLYKNNKPKSIPIPNYLNIFSMQEAPTSRTLVIDLEHPHCQITELTGGKGSSLGKLTAISHFTKEFLVPKGIVVTTTAYREFMRKGHFSEMLTVLEEVAWCHVKGNLKEICQQAMMDIGKTRLPEELCEALQNKMESAFGEQLSSLTFAIRSSATGEDSESMSAAGQNETYLGVQGLDQILLAVSKCWASQFSYVAIEYKRHNGQLLNSPMAVVIQEMVPAEVAGVMFTCDPVTSNPSLITITANYGLGETVVSAVVEPDTVILNRDYKNKLTHISTSIGKKNVCRLIDISGQIKEKALSYGTSQACLSEYAALTLGHVGILVEEHFGYFVDIEWALVEDKVYLLQARPVTTVDTETEFEIIHEMDIPLRSEEEFLSKANIGEVMPGAMSPLGISTNLCSIETLFKKLFAFPPELCYPYCTKSFACKFNHVFFNLLSNPMFGEESNLITSIELSAFARPLNIKEIKVRNKERHSIKKIDLMTKLKILFSTLKNLISAERVIKDVKKRYSRYHIPLNCNNSKVMYKIIGQHLQSGTNEPFNCHMTCTSSSQLWNALLLNLLFSVEKEWNEKVFSDFGYLLSTCTNVESADVPAALEKLALEIKKEIESEDFMNMKPETAVRWLSISQSIAGKAFRKFLRKHGHRCWKEFDVNTITWGSDPTSVVKILQSLIGSVNPNTVVKEEVSVEEAMRNLQVPLSFWQKWLLRFLLPRVRSAVRLREASKSMLIKVYDVIRQGYCRLGTLMVREGRLPDARILFFLTFEEINELIQTRSARLIAKAVRRKRIHPHLDSLCFSEITRGTIKPINKTEQTDQSFSSFGCMIGTPVSKGFTRGTARVITSLDQAIEIQTGDILVTYSTDIGWSPYFPLLSGIVTELGGLVSHGAVIAREYGLPSVVGLHGATSFFKSGEMVELDGNKGSLKKIQGVSSLTG